MISGSFKNVIDKMCTEIMKMFIILVYTGNDLTRLKMLSTKCVYKSYLIYMYKKGLPVSNLKWLICYKTKLN